MKKFFMTFFVLVGFSALGYSQDVKVNINNQEASITDDCAYRINGICSSEDLGGVDVEIVFEDGITWAVFTNYNTFPVSVLYEVSYLGYDACAKYDDTSEDRIRTEMNFGVGDGVCGNIVLGVSGSKKLKLAQHSYFSSDGKATRIVDVSCQYSIKGLIVRKLSK